MTILLMLAILSVPVAAVVIIVFAVRGRMAPTPTGGGTSSVRRFFQYLLLFGLTVLAAVGVADLLGRVFGAQTYEGDNLAQPLTFALVGLPLAGLIAAWTRRAIRRDPHEAVTGAYALYLTLMAWTALVVAMFGLQSLVSAALRGDFDGGGLAMLIVWAAVWLLHWSLAHRLGVERNWPHLLIGSLIGLGTGAVGLGLLLGTSLEALLLDGPGTLTFGTGQSLAEYGAILLAGALVWVRYWLGAAIRLPRNTAWLVFVLPVGVGGGLITALVATSLLVWHVLVWLIGDPFAVSARQHFVDSPLTFAFAGVGLLLWWYHGTVLAETKRDRTEVRRVYEHLVSAIGLLASAAGVAMVIVAVIEALNPGLDLGVSVTNTLLGAATLLVVNVPLWLLFWGRIQRGVVADPVSETTSLTRKIYLVLLFGLTGIAAVVALIVAVFILLEDVFAGTTSGETVRSMRYALGVLASAAAVSAYHWAVYGQDRAVVIPEQSAGPRSVILVGAPALGLEQSLSRETGARVELLLRADATAPPWSKDELIATFRDHPGQDLLVIAGKALEVVVLDRGSAR